MTEQEVLIGLERCMTEFFHPQTTNQRKREIEEQLNQFGNQSGSWKQCLEVFTKTQNEYVMMYCLSVLENLANKRWIGCESGTKAEIRTTLNKLLILHYKVMPTFIVSKLLKVIVDIGRVDWPMFYPDFFNFLLQLASSDDTRSIGLTALRIASEELASPREDVSAERKEELKKLLTQQIPGMFRCIADSLKQEWDRYFGQQKECLTPPPSPGSGESNLFDLFTPGLNPVPALAPGFHLQGNSLSVMTVALECLSHIFSWIPLSAQHISPELLNIVFKYSRLGCCVSTGNPESESQLNDLGSLAMTCINELLSKNCVPQHFQDYLLRVFRQTFHLLQELTKEDNSRQQLEKYNENYLEKFIEFLRLFMTQHFSRIDSNQSFPLFPFLTLLFKFTFNQVSHEQYLNCLDIWEIFLEYIANKLDKGKEEKEAVLTRYKEGIVMFATAILRQIQFRFNHSHLGELDSSQLDDKGHTEWKTYLIENLELIAKISKLFPDQVLSTVYPILEETSLFYLNPDWQRINASTNQQLVLQTHCSFQDLITSIQAFGRFSELFITENFHTRFDSTLSLINKLLKIADFASKLQIQELSATLPSQIVKDIIEIHVESLASLQPYTHWLSQLYSEAQQNGSSQSQLSQILDRYIEVVTPVFTKQVPDSIVLSAAHTLLSVITTVRPTFLSQSPSLQKLFADVENGSCNKLQMESQCLIFRALSNLLLLVWPNTPKSEQRWQERGQSHRRFVHSVFSDFLSLEVAALQHDHNRMMQAKPMIERTVALLHEIVGGASNENGDSRQTCYDSVKESVQLSLHLFLVYIQHPDTTEHLMTYIHTAFKALKRQMGAELTARTIQSFLSMFTTDQLEAAILNDNQAGVRMVEKFIKLLQLVIEEPGQSCKTFTPGIIVLAVSQVYPIVSQRSSPEVKGVLFELLSTLLSRRHRYFFPSAVLSSMLANKPLGSLAHKPQLLAIMTAYGQSFLQPDITIFKQNLTALEDLNSRQKLYEKLHHLLPEEGVLFQFVNVLVQALANKSHNLLQEEICLSVFNMSSVSLEYFYKTFLPQFLQHTEQITPDQKNSLYQRFQPEKDFPSFSSNLMRFVNDLRYFRLCNSSLPEGSVHF